MSRIIAVRRAACFSPMSVEKDLAILKSVSERCKEPVLIIDESDIENHLDAQVYFSMARLPKSLEILKSLEKKGTVVINSSYGVEKCARKHLVELMKEINISIPEENGLYGCWLKRGDAAAQCQQDVVYCKDNEELEIAKEDFYNRGIHHVVQSAHIPGDLVKFYAVEGGFFQYFYPSDDREWKFNDEAVNGEAAHYSFDAGLLKAEMQRLAKRVGVKVYGGDAIITKEGDFFVIDFNDWPSFSRCRDAAANAIAKLIK